MENTKYTKGEWFACCLKATPHFVFANEGYVTVCSMIMEQDVVDSLSIEEVQANAKLISAAPDLLEALIEMVKQNELRGYFGSLDYKQALTAINKATK